MTKGFFVNAEIDGKVSPLSGGPKSRSGGMTVRLTQRHKGAIQTAFVLRSETFANSEGKLMLRTSVVDSDGIVVASKETEY